MRLKSSILQLSLILAGFAWMWVFRPDPGVEDSSTIQAPQAGFLAPDLQLETAAGDQVRLADLKGKVVIVNFWASWCPPCRAEMDNFQQASQEFTGEDLVILGVNMTSQDSLVDVNAFLQEYALDFAIPLDLSGEAARNFQVRSLPSTFFVDRQGVIKKVVIGGPIPLSLLRVEAHQLLQDNSYVPSR